MADKKMSVKIADRIAKLQADMTKIIECLAKIKAKYEKVGK